MSRSRGRLATNMLVAAVAAGTTWLAMSAWRDLTIAPGGFVNPLLLLAVVVAGTGTAARWWRWPGPLVVLFQVGVTGILTSLLLTGSPLPVGGAWAELTEAIRSAVDTAQEFAAPVPTEAPPVDPLLIIGGLVCLLLVDLLACTLHRAPLAGLPLLAIFTIPVGMVGDSVSWWIFASTTAGFLALLFLQESEQIARWGRPLGLDQETGDPIAFGGGASTVPRTAGLVGGAATALAVLVPALIPASGVHLFDFGPGRGGGDDIRVENPVADLVRDLKQGPDKPLIRVTTNDPDPAYLRILALTRFNGTEWSPGNRDVPSEHLANGQMPPPEGVAADVSREQYPYDVSVLEDFDSRWLPTQPPVSRVVAEGNWRYDTRTMDFIAGPDDDLSTASLEYTMTAVDLDLTSDRLADSAPPTGKVSDIFTDIPDNLPPIIHDLAVEVTQAATTPYERAVALQNWFREDGGFTYSLEQGPSGNGSGALVEFLSDGPGGRTGYCEQFASAMGVMARELGIPARVAIGFLSPSPDGPNSWVYSSRDMHAWPELYFDGAGWVRFEPTPSGRAEDVPAYTVPGSGVEEGPSNSPSASASSSAPVLPNRPRESDSAAAAAGDQAGDDSSIAWLPVLGSLGGLLVVAGAVLLPRALRSRRRERRLSSGLAEPVWAELRDTALDLGVPWPRGRSPRATRAVLIEHFGAPLGPQTPERPAHGPALAPDAVGALDRLVHTLELDRYSRSGATLDPVRLRADGEACIAALVGGAPRSTRRRATWWPRTVLSSRRRRTAPSTVEAKFGGVVDEAT